MITVSVTVSIDRDKARSWTRSLDIEPIEGMSYYQVEDAIHGLASPESVYEMMEKAGK